MPGGWDEEMKPQNEDEEPEKKIASTKASTFMGNDSIHQQEGSDTAGSSGSQTSDEQTVLGDEAGCSPSSQVRVSRGSLPVWEAIQLSVLLHKAECQQQSFVEVSV